MNRTRGILALVIALLLALFLLFARRGPPEATHAAPHPESEATGPSVTTKPEPVTAATPAATVSGTTIVVLRAEPSGYALVTFADKAFAWPGPEAATPGTSVAIARLEDAQGKVLFETECSLPRLCRCSQGRDHAQGCAVIRHEAVFRMKVPRLAAQERLVLLAADKSKELARFDLGRSP